MDKTDPFNFPMPNRQDLMSLSVINRSKDNVRTTTSKFATGRTLSQNMTTNDITGAVPKLHGSREVNKVELNNVNWDIDRSCPRALHLGLNKPENNLRVNDIQGASPQCIKFQSTRLGNNPLNPSYKLQNVEIKPATPTKFMRDGLHIDDIQGCRPKKDKRLDFQTRDPLKIDDIEGTKARAKHQVRKNSNEYNPYDYKDVTDPAFRSSRHTNPLMPTYTIRDEDNKIQTIGQVKGSNPVVLPPPHDEKNKSIALRTADIDGAQASSKGLGVFAFHDRRGFKETNRISDIFGSNPNSLKKSPETKRYTNPLVPDYQYLGRTLENQLDAFGVAIKPTQTTQQNTANQVLGISQPSQKVLATEDKKIDDNKLYQASRNGDQSQHAASEKGSAHNSQQKLQTPAQDSSRFANIQKVLPKEASTTQQAATATNGGSVLNEMRLQEHEKNMERNPTFTKNTKRFWGVPSQNSVQRSQAASSVQKFDQLIQNN